MLKPHGNVKVKPPRSEERGILIMDGGPVPYSFLGLRHEPMRAWFLMVTLNIERIASSPSMGEE